jgi:Subtilase family
MFSISFQWDSPFASVCPGCPGSPNDLDIYLFNDPPTTVLAGSAFTNTGGDAVEIFGIFNPPGSGATAFNIMITKFDGPNPQFIKYVRFGGANVTINEFDSQSSTLYGHANASGAAAVGAAFYGDTPDFGVFPPLLEPFSSAGSTPIIFDTAGQRLATPQIRLKPEIVAPDGSNTTFFIPGLDAERDGFPNFFGTSAAAPHAAAVAALMLQAAATTAPQRVYEILETTAIDMGPPGFDFDSGFGLIQADQALATLVSLPSEVIVDIRPRGEANRINPNSDKEVRVAILTGNGFNAATVDPKTVRFGATGTEAAPVNFALRDVDGDGDTDMVLRFEIQDTGIKCGDTSASLTGQNSSGLSFRGSDSIRTVRCDGTYATRVMLGKE